MKSIDPNLYEKELLQEAESYSGEEDDDAVYVGYSMELDTGYPFRRMVECIHLFSEVIPMTFHRKGVRGELESDDGKISCIWEIYAWELSKFDVSYVQGKYDPQTIPIPKGYRDPSCDIVISSSRLKERLASATKKGTAFLYGYSNDQTVYLNIKGLNFFSTENRRINPIDPIPVTLPEDEPNCTIKRSDFVNMCKTLCKYRKNIDIMGYEKGIKFQIDSTSEGTIHYFGDDNSDPILDTDDQEDNLIKLDNLNIEIGDDIKGVDERRTHFQLRVNKQTLKVLEKLPNICDPGNIKIYMQPNTGIKFVCSIGSFGKFTLYLKRDSEL